MTYNVFSGTLNPTHSLLCSIVCNNCAQCSAHTGTDLTVLWIEFCGTGPISPCLDSFFVYVSFRPLLHSVLWYSWLGHLTHKPVPNMTYNVFSGTLNPAESYQTVVVLSIFWICSMEDNLKFEGFWVPNIWRCLSLLIGLCIVRSKMLRKH